MATYQVRLIRKVEIARGTKLFEFTKPQGFVFRAGQAVDIVLPRFNLKSEERLNLGSEKISQTFSLASAPHEKKLLIATRERPSAFKKKLFTLKTGDKVKIEGPFGSFTLHTDRTKPAVFIAGGIGITPFISMLREEFTRSNLVGSRHILLFYSNRTEKDAAFLDELCEYAARHKNFTFVPVFTDTSDRLDKKKLKKILGKIANHIFYIAGTLGFVIAMREEVVSLGISEDNIKTDEFSGY